MREGWRLGCLWVWGWVRFFILCIFGVLIGAVWIGIRNEVMRGWIKLRNFGDRTEKWAMWIGLRNGKGKLTVCGEDGLREGDDLKRLAWGRWWSSVCGSEHGEHLQLRVRVRELRQKLFEVKMRTEMVLHLWTLILHSTLKMFSVWPNFPDQPNSLFYGKAFQKLVWSQNKHSLNHLWCYIWKSNVDRRAGQLENICFEAKILTSFCRTSFALLQSSRIKNSWLIKSSWKFKMHNTIDKIYFLIVEYFTWV